MDTNFQEKLHPMLRHAAERDRELREIKNALRPAAAAQMRQLGIAPDLIEKVRCPSRYTPVYNVNTDRFSNIDRPDPEFLGVIYNIEDRLNALVYLVIKETIPLAPGSVQIRTSYLYVDSNIVQSESDSSDAHDPHSVHACTKSCIRSSKLERIFVRSTPSGGVQRCECSHNRGNQADQETIGDGKCEGAKLPQKDMAG